MTGRHRGGEAEDETGELQAETEEAETENGEDATGERQTETEDNTGKMELC